MGQLEGDEEKKAEDEAYCVLRIAYCVLRIAYCVLRIAAAIHRALLGRSWDKYRTVLTQVERVKQ